MKQSERKLRAAARERLRAAGRWLEASAAPRLQALDRWVRPRLEPWLLRLGRWLRETADPRLRALGQRVRERTGPRLRVLGRQVRERAGSGLEGAGRFAAAKLPLRGLGVSAAGLLVGWLLGWYAGRFPPVGAGPYFLGIVVGILLWIPVFWVASNVYHRHFQLTHDIGLLVLTSLFLLPFLAIRLLGTANVLFDGAEPMEHQTVLLRANAGTGEGAEPSVLVRSWREGEGELRLQLDPARLGAVRPGEALRVWTGPGFLGWEYLLRVEAGGPGDGKAPVAVADPGSG